MKGTLTGRILQEGQTWKGALFPRPRFQLSKESDCRSLDGGGQWVPWARADPQSLGRRKIFQAQASCGRGAGIQKLSGCLHGFEICACAICARSAITEDRLLWACAWGSVPPDVLTYPHYCLTMKQEQEETKRCAYRNWEAPSSFSVSTVPSTAKAEHCAHCERKILTDHTQVIQIIDHVPSEPRAERQ